MIIFQIFYTFTFVKGHQLMKKFRLKPLRSGYNNNFDPKIDPRVPNVFAAASFRFGHTMIPEVVQPYTAEGSPEPITDTNGPGFPLDINDVQFRFDLLR